jgi:MGT family glycosyltransferase
MLFRPKRKKHIAFFINPEYADTIPTLSIVSTLVRRGFRVSYVTTKLFAQEVRSLGAEALLCPSLREFWRILGADTAPGLGNPCIELTEETLVRVLPFYERCRPDVIVRDTVGIVGRILAEKWEVPVVQVSCDFRMERQRRSVQAPAFFEDAISYADRLNQALEHNGVIADSFCFSREDLNVYFYPKCFQLDDNYHDTHSFYAGRCSPERPYHERWHSKSVDGLPTILISTSTIFVQSTNYFKYCIDALTELRWNLVLNIGDNIDIGCLHNLPDNVTLIQHKPLISVLPYVDLLVFGGGMMTTMEAMYCGVPLLMMTHGAVELEAYAENAARLGIGIHLAGVGRGPEEIKQSLLDMWANDALFDRVGRIQETVREGPGAEEVANRICSHIK